MRPRCDGDLAAHLSWVSNTHVKRYRAHYPNTCGHLYQGRYKSFPVAEDMHFLTLMRYVESNPVRCRTPLAERAEAWPWSSLGLADRKLRGALLSPWPVDRPSRWLSLVNEPLASATLARVRQCVLRGRPLGEERWMWETARRMGLQHTLRPPG